MNSYQNKDFLDLNYFRGVGEEPAYQAPELTDRPRLWPLDKWEDAPRDLGYAEFSSYQWRGLRILKDPITQSALHNLLCEVRPQTIIETGIYSGGSLVWYRDITQLLGLDCEVIGIDKYLGRCQIPRSELSNISLYEADCSDLQRISSLLDSVKHPLIFIEDAHCNTFNLMKWAAEQLLEKDDYFIIEDMMPYWHRYSPKRLSEYLASFNDVLAMDMVYSNTCPQLDRGVFRRL